MVSAISAKLNATTMTTAMDVRHTFAVIATIFNRWVIIRQMIIETVNALGKFVINRDA